MQRSHWLSLEPVRIHTQFEEEHLMRNIWVTMGGGALSWSQLHFTPHTTIHHNTPHHIQPHTHHTIYSHIHTTPSTEHHNFLQTPPPHLTTSHHISSCNITHHLTHLTHDMTTLHHTLNTYHQHHTTTCTYRKFNSILIYAI